MNYGFKTFYNGRTWDVRADSMLDAKEQAIAYFKAPKSKRHMVSVVLCDKGGQPIVHSPALFL